MSTPNIKHSPDSHEVSTLNRWLLANAVLSFFTVGLLALMAVGGLSTSGGSGKNIREVRGDTKTPTSFPPAELIVPVVDRR
jgi:hypothetical protein